MHWDDNISSQFIAHVERSSEGFLQAANKGSCAIHGTEDT